MGNKDKLKILHSKQEQMEFKAEVIIKNKDDTDTKAVLPNSLTGSGIHEFKTERDVEDFNYDLEELHHSIDIKDEFVQSESEINIFKEHSYAAELDRIYTCIFCDFKSTRRWTLRVHLMGHRKDDQVQQCQVCFYFKSSNKRELENHMKTHFPDKSYKCRFCIHESVDKNEYVAHVKTKHTNKKRFACGICYYVCNNDPRFEAHIKKHADDWTSCELCKSCTNSSVKTHFRDHSSEAFSCVNCNFKCSHKPALVRHVKKHKTVTFKCNVCNYTCSAKGAFQVHMRKHAGEMYSCSVCDYKCNYKTSLKTHERKHTGETFSCADCDYEGISRENLMKHTKTHTGKRRHRCAFCNFKCDRIRVFNIHMQIHHPGEKTS